MPNIRFRRLNTLTPYEVVSRHTTPVAPSYPNDYSLEFDGVNEYIVAPLDGTATGGILAVADTDINLTVSFWVKISTSVSVEGVMQWAIAANSRYTQPFIYIQQNNLEIKMFVDNTYQTATPIVLDTWYHIAITRDSATNIWTGYKDGISVFTHDDAGTPAWRNVAESIFFATGYNGTIAGNIDEVSIWNTALSAADVATLATAPSNLKTALGTTPVAWWRMGDSGTYFNSIWELPNQMKLNYSKYSMALDGIDDYITTGVDMSATDFSISFWIRGVYADNASDINTVCITSSISDPNRTIGRVVKEGGEGRLMIQGYDTTGVTFSTWRVLTDVLDDAWHHIVFTYVYDASTMANNKVYVYVDGVNFVWTKYGSTDTTPAMTMFAGATPTLQSAADLFIGSNKGTSRYFDGMIDSVALFDEVITSGNVTSIYASGVPNDVSDLGISGLQAYYRMGESAVFSDNSEWQIPEQTKINNWSSLSCELDGTDDYIDIGLSKPAALNLPGEMSISVWIKLDTVAAGVMAIVCDVSSAASTLQFGLEVNRTAGRISVLADNSHPYVIGSSLVADTWYHIVMTRSGSTGNWDYIIYLDGANDGTVNTAFNPQVQSGCAISRFGNYNAGYFNGMIDDVSIWDEALTAGNVTSLFNSGVPNDVTGLGISGLQGYWRMGEGATFSGGNWRIPDDSTNSNYGDTSGMNESGVVNNAPGNISQGLSSSLRISDRKTNAPDNINQANSISMEEADRSTSVPT